MNALNIEKPTTPQQVLRRSIALVLDNAIIGTVNLNPVVAKDLDALVERLAENAERIVGKTMEEIHTETKSKVDKAVWNANNFSAAVTDLNLR